MAESFYSRPEDRAGDGQGSPHQRLVPSFSSSRGALRPLGGPHKQPGSKLAVEYHSTLRAIAKCVCGGLIITGGAFLVCDRCGQEPKWAAPHKPSVCSARRKGQSGKKFMKSMRRVL